MTNKLVVIIKNLKVPKNKKILLYEMKFLVPNYSCLQNPWLGCYRPQIPVLFVLCPQPNLLNPPPPNKIPGYATDRRRRHGYLPVVSAVSRRGLSHELITRLEESYRLWCVVVCDLETSWMKRPWPIGGCCALDWQCYLNIYTRIPNV